MLDKPLAIVDIETTGMSSAHNRITEIGVIKVSDNKIIDEYSTLVNPGINIPNNISRITGITQDMVSDAPYFEEVASKLYELFSDSYFLAHNVIFDYSFVKRQMSGLNYSFSPKILCSVKLSRTLEPNARGHSLEKIIHRHKIKVNARHRALEDAKAVFDFINIVSKKYGTDTVVNALKKQLKLKSLPANFDESFLEGVNNNPGVYIFKNSDGSPVYVGKSKTLRTRILSHFSQSTVLSREMKISMNTHKLDIIETKSELEALLLESKLVKELLPVFNRKLRRLKQYNVLFKTVNEDGYFSIKLYDGNVDELEDLSNIFGIYESRLKSTKALERNRDLYDLCPKLLGLEKTSGSCFRYQLGKCQGACIGKESPATYNLRMNIAFERSRLDSWKFDGPVLLKASETSGVLVDQWKVISFVDENSLETVDANNNLDIPFDLDNYKILKSFIEKNPAQVLPIGI